MSFDPIWASLHHDVMGGSDTVKQALVKRLFPGRGMRGPAAKMEGCNVHNHRGVLQQC